MNESSLDYIHSSTWIYFHLDKNDNDRLSAFKQLSFVHYSYTVFSYFHITLFFWDLVTAPYILNYHWFDLSMGDNSETFTHNWVKTTTEYFISISFETRL